MTSLEHVDLVAALRAVPGVADADVEPDDEGGLGLLRLGLEQGVDEAAVASDVGRVLRDRFGLGVDAERVEVVEDADLSAGQLPAPSYDGPGAELPDAGPAVVLPVHVPDPRSVQRPAIARMHLVSAGLDVVATVTLSAGGRTEAGETRGAASASGVHRAVAGATLRAVEQLVDGAVRVELEHLEITPMGTERTVVVSLSLLTSRGTERLTGAAAVREDVRQAVIRATLDALNRRLETLLPR